MSEEGLADEEYVRLDAQLHSAIVKAADNPLLTRQYEDVKPFFVPYSLRVLEIPDRRRSAQAGHQLIVQAILRHDSGAAEAAMREHLESVKSQVAGYLQLPAEQELSEVLALAAGEPQT